MYTTPEDWYARMKAAGCKIRVYQTPGHLGSPPGQDAPQCEVIWSEIREQEDSDKSRAVEAYLRTIVGPLGNGQWKDI